MRTRKLDLTDSNSGRRVIFNELPLTKHCEESGWNFAMETIELTDNHVEIKRKYYYVPDYHFNSPHEDWWRVGMYDQHTYYTKFRMKKYEGDTQAYKNLVKRFEKEWNS